MQLLSYLCNNCKILNVKISGRNIGEILKEARESKQLTQEQLAQKVGKKRSYISRVESEYGNNIKIQTLFEIVEQGLDGIIDINLNIKSDK